METARQGLALHTLVTGKTGAYGVPLLVSGRPSGQTQQAGRCQQPRTALLRVPVLRAGRFEVSKESSLCQGNCAPHWALIAEYSS